MGRIEVQGIVAAKNGLPFVQLIQLDENDIEEAHAQLTPAEARDIAQNLLEAATCAIYDAAILNWAKERDPEDGETVGIMIIDNIRKYRADKWGLPDRPEDWKND